MSNLPRRAGARRYRLGCREMARSGPATSLPLDARPAALGHDFCGLLGELVALEHITRGLIGAPDGLLIAARLPPENSRRAPLGAGGHPGARARAARSTDPARDLLNRAVRHHQRDRRSGEHPRCLLGSSSANWDVLRGALGRRSARHTGPGQADPGFDSSCSFPGAVGVSLTLTKENPVCKMASAPSSSWSRETARKRAGH